jgi:transcription elongation factor GreB
MKGRNMTRWRDPAKDPRQEPKSNLITADGAARLRGILDHLSRVKRPALSAKVGEAAALGDRSENDDRAKEPQIAYYNLQAIVL